MHETTLSPWSLNLGSVACLADNMSNIGGDLIYDERLDANSNCERGMLSIRTYLVVGVLLMALAAAGCGADDDFAATTTSSAEAGNVSTEESVLTAPDGEATTGPLDLTVAVDEDAAGTAVSTDEPVLTAADGESTTGPLDLTVAEEPVPAVVETTDAGQGQAQSSPDTAAAATPDAGDDAPTVTIEATGPAVLTPVAVTSWAPDGYLRSRSWTTPLPISNTDASARLGGARLDTSPLGAPTAVFASDDRPFAEVVAFWPSIPAILSSSPFVEENGAKQTNGEQLAASVVAEYGDAVCETCTRYEAVNLGGSLPAQLVATASEATLVWADGNVLRSLIMPIAAMDRLIPAAESLVAPRG